MGKDSEKGTYAPPEGSRTWEYLTTLFSAIGSFCVGTQMGWNSPSMAEFRSPNSTIQMTPDEASTLAASIGIGYMVAPLLSIFVVDRIGRRKSILASTVPMVISWGMILVAEHVMVLMVARMMSGFSSGILSAASSIHMSEILSSDNRGSLTVLGYITFYIGVLFMFAIAPYLGVRVTTGVCLAVTTIFLVCSWFVPESPYFLMMVGREDEAEAALEKLRGKTDVADELELIRTTIREQDKAVPKSDDNEQGDAQGRQSAFKQLFTIRGNLKAFSISLTMMIMGNFCGLSTIINYCHLILEDIGSGLSVYVASLTFSILQVFSAAVAVFVIDRFGRRPLLFSSAATTTLLLGVIATYFVLMEHTDIDVKQYGMIPLCAIFGLVMALNIGIVTVPDIVEGEIFATDVKLLASCIVTVSDSLIAILSTKYYLLMATSWGLGHSVPFYGYAIFTFLCTVLLMRLLPETRGKTLLEIQQELNA